MHINLLVALLTDKVPSLQISENNISRPPQLPGSHSRQRCLVTPWSLYSIEKLFCQHSQSSLRKPHLLRRCTACLLRVRLSLLAHPDRSILRLFGDSFRGRVCRGIHAGLDVGLYCGEILCGVGNVGLEARLKGGVDPVLRKGEEDLDRGKAAQESAKGCGEVVEACVQGFLDNCIVN